MSSKPTRALKRRTEDSSTYQAHLKRGKTVIRQGLADIFRAELAILLEERTKALCLAPAIAPEHVDARLYIGVFVQDSDYIRSEMIKRLASQMGENRPTAFQIDAYLYQVSRIIETKEARGEQVSALPYVNERFLTPMPPSKKRGRKVKPRQGKRKQVGQYQSIKEASQHDNERSYAALRQKLWRDGRRENSL